MTMPGFRVIRPSSVEEAVRVLADNGPEAMVIAGGTDVVPNLQMRLFAPRVLVDIKGIGELRGISCNDRIGLRMGALTTLTEIAEWKYVERCFPVLGSAVRSIAGPLQRNMGTIGGNLCLETRCLWYNQSEFWRGSLGGCLKKEGDVCRVAPGGKRCWAVWSGDSAPALLTVEAEVEIAGPEGRRRVPLAEFYKDDGMDRIALGRGELVVAVHVPVSSAFRRGVYKKLRVRDSIDYPLAGVAVAMKVDKEGVCRAARVALAAVNPAPRLVSAAAERLEGKRYSAELVDEVAHEAIRTAKPLTTSASTPAYRRDMVRVFTRRALEELWQARGR